jgi:hypothetical protein
MEVLQVAKPGNDLPSTLSKISAYYLAAGFFCWLGGLGIMPLAIAGTAVYLTAQGFKGLEPRRRR